MSIAIGSSFVSGSLDSYPSRSTLDSEVARYKKQLADCVSCPSSNTLEGKANIQEISSKISADQAHIRKIEAAAAVVNDSSTSAVKPADKTNAYTATGAPTTFTDSKKGELLNAFA